ncbi:MAG TPA: tetratricopeptide repeat protein [Pyrinomonadaceae bacterium]|nr:tetratricopeptide repeat protein [Pyrinomonadaceae bacterium]
MVTRLVIVVCLLLFVWPLANAQTKDPLDRVVSELQAGRFENALAAVDEVIKKYPKNADAYFLRGSLKMQADPAQALLDFDKVIELRPDSGAAYHQRAFMRLVKNDVAGALKDLDAAIAHNFKDDSIYYMRGQLRWQLGDKNAALSDLNEAIKLNPGNPRAYSTRADLLFAMDDTDRALADVNYLLNWYETDPSARPAPKPPAPPASDSKSQPSASQPFVVEMTQQTENAAPGAKEMAPTIADAYNTRGYILKHRGNHDSAFSDFNKSIRLDPSNVWAFYNRAEVYESKGDLPAALADIVKAVQLQPENGNLVVEHGVILALMGKDKEAQAVWDVLLQSDSDRTLWQKRIDDRTVAVKKVVPIKK